MKKKKNLICAFFNLLTHWGGGGEKQIKVAWELLPLWLAVALYVQAKLNYFRK